MSVTPGIRTASLAIFGAVVIGKYAGCEMYLNAADTGEFMTIGGICIDSPGTARPRNIKLESSGRYLDISGRWRTE